MHGARTGVSFYAYAMTDHDQTAARREIADALLAALERRHEVADAIVEAANKAAAVEAIVNLLGTSHLAAEAVMSMSFDQLTQDARTKIIAELDDLNKQLSFTVKERPASSGEGLELRPFSPDEDRDIFARRTEEMGAAGDGSGGPAGSSTTRSEPHRSASTTRRRLGSWLLIPASRSGWCSASLSTARWTSGSGFTPIIEKRVTEPRHCASRARRWPGRSRPCRWSPARPRPNPPSREVPAGSIRFGLAGGRQADRRRIRGANAAAGSQLA